MTDWASRGRIAEDITEAAGLTPLLRLRKVAAGPQTLCGKLEFMNPSSSLKDRILRRMVRSAEERGDLKPGMTILEASTGSTGIATSMIGAVCGYPVVVVMPEGMSEERKASMRAYGAELVLTPGAESDVDLCLEKVEELKRAEPERYWEPGQFSNRDNIAAHYETTGPEIWQQTGGRVDVFVASQGSGGTVSGVGKYLKEQNPDAKIYAVEPAECPILSGGAWGPHAIEGIGDGFIPENLDLDYRGRRGDGLFRGLHRHGPAPGAGRGRPVRHLVRLQRGRRQQAVGGAAVHEDDRDHDQRHRHALFLHAALRQGTDGRDPRPRASHPRRGQGQPGAPGPAHRTVGQLEIEMKTATLYRHSCTTGCVKTPFDREWHRRPMPSFPRRRESRGWDGPIGRVVPRHP